MTRPLESTHGYDFADGTDRIIGAALEAHRELGPGFQEVVYQRALALEMEAAGLEFGREEWIPVFYKGRKIDTRRVDFVVGDCLVEIKARAELLEQDIIQTLSYLKASGYRVALLLNFGAKKLEIKRLVNGRHRAAAVEPAWREKERTKI